METRHIFTSMAGVAWVCVAASCAPPKALVVEAAKPTGAPAAPVELAANDPAPLEAPLPDDGIRLPDMLTMPGEGELRSNPPPPRKTGEPGAVVARPPTDPPPRPKPKDTDQQEEPKPQ